MTTVTRSASDVVQAIGDAADAALTEDLADVEVLDAVDPVQAYAVKSFTIGGAWDPDEQAFVNDAVVAVTMTEVGAGRRRVETTTVECIAYSGDNTNDFPGHRTTVGRIVAAVGAQLRTVSEVAGRSARARIAAEQWAQGSDGKGTLVMALLTIEVVRLL